MTATYVFRTLLAKAHILVISLLLISFALSSAAVPSVSTPKSSHSKSQSITRLSSAPTTEANSVSSNAYETDPENVPEGSVEAQNTATEPQQSTSNMQSGEQTPATVVAPPAYPSQPCDAACTTPLPQPTPAPIGSCGCGSQTYYGYQPQRMCPMCAYVSN